MRATHVPQHFTYSTQLSTQLNYGATSGSHHRLAFQSDANKFFRRVISLPFVPVRYIRMAWGGLVASMPNGQAYDDFVDYFEQTGLNGNFSLS